MAEQHLLENLRELCQRTKGCQNENKAEIPQWNSPESGDMAWTKPLLVYNFSYIYAQHMINAFCIWNWNLKNCILFEHETCV